MTKNALHLLGLIKINFRKKNQKQNVFNEPLFWQQFLDVEYTKSIYIKVNVCLNINNPHVHRLHYDW